MSSDLKSRSRADYKFFINNFKTRWSDNDQYGHINNALYYHYYDTIVNSYLINHCGLVPTKSSSIGLVVHSESSFFKPIEFPHDLDLGLSVRKLGRSSVEYEIGVFESGKEETAAAVGGFIHVFVKSDTRRPMAMEDGLKEGLEKLKVEESKAAKL